MKSTAQRGIGLMCGTSHDALDMADVSFRPSDAGWSFDLHGCESIPLPAPLKARLGKATELSGRALLELDRDFALFCGNEVKNWMRSKNSEAEFVASHGVTIFHQPESGVAFQAGNGGIISTICKRRVISDFRIQDVTAGGNGAPLIPFADQALFSKYDFTLNLGGFANVSVLNSSAVSGYDISACNLLLNALAQRADLEYDDGGRIAASGKPIPEMLEAINRLPYFDLAPPKSLGYEWMLAEVMPIVHRFKHFATEDLMNTACHHVSDMIGKALSEKGCALVTGGGALNDYLISLIKTKSRAEIIVPDRTIIDFREAIAFSFLGMLRLNGSVNIHPSITGSTGASVAGAVYEPPAESDSTLD